MYVHSFAMFLLSMCVTETLPGPIFSYVLTYTYVNTCDIPGCQWIWEKTSVHTMYFRIIINVLLTVAMLRILFIVLCTNIILLSNHQ